MREQGRCSRWSSMGVHDQQYTHFDHALTQRADWFGIGSHESSPELI